MVATILPPLKVAVREVVGEAAGEVTRRGVSRSARGVPRRPGPVGLVGQLATLR